MDTASFVVRKTNILSLLDQTKWLPARPASTQLSGNLSFWPFTMSKTKGDQTTVSGLGKMHTVKTQTAKTQNNWAVKILQPSWSYAPWGGPQYQIMLNNKSNVGKPWIIWILLVLHRQTLLLCPFRSLNQMKKPIRLENNRRFTRIRKNLQRFTKSLNLQEITR